MEAPTLYQEQDDRFPAQHVELLSVWHLQRFDKHPPSQAFEALLRRRPAGVISIQHQDCSLEVGRQQLLLFF